jgi:hypothetical protein
MKLVCALLFCTVLAAAGGGATDYDFEWSYTTTDSFNPGVEVRLSLNETAAAAYVVRVECVSEAGRPLFVSRILELSNRDRYKRGILKRVEFDTGVCKVTRITVEELRAVTFKSVPY